jgi:hypothetical protein
MPRSEIAKKKKTKQRQHHSTTYSRTLKNPKSFEGRTEGEAEGRIARRSRKEHRAFGKKRGRHIHEPDGKSNTPAYS